MSTESGQDPPPEAGAQPNAGADRGSIPPATLGRRVFLVVVDDTPEYERALRYACRRATNTGGRVALLHVMEPVAFQQWGAVQELMAAEGRKAGEALLQRVAEAAQALGAGVPILFLREGIRSEELLKLIAEEQAISILVLGAATGRDGPGPLVSTLATSLIGRLRVPVTVVPGNLSDAQIDAIA